MVLVFYFGQMVQNMKVNLKQVTSKVVVVSSSQMVSTMWESSLMIKQMATVSSRISREVAMRVTGRMISSMDRVRRYGIMGLRLTLESSLKGRKMERGNSCGVMDHFMKEILLMECSMGMEYNTLKSSRKHIRGAMYMERLKEKGNSIGLMEENTMDNLEMEKKKDKEHLNS